MPDASSSGASCWDSSATGASTTGSEAFGMSKNAHTHTTAATPTSAPETISAVRLPAFEPPATLPDASHSLAAGSTLSRKTSVRSDEEARASACSTGAPHFVQNAFPSSREAPQRVQNIFHLFLRHGFKSRAQKRDPVDQVQYYRCWRFRALRHQEPQPHPKQVGLKRLGALRFKTKTPSRRREASAQRRARAEGLPE